jgi:outer membrane biosynthesis protein TonB
MSQSLTSPRNRISLSSGAGEAFSPFACFGAVLLHAAIIAAALFTFTHKLDIVDESPPTVPVDLVTIGIKTNIAPMVKQIPKAEPKETPAPPPQPQQMQIPTPKPVPLPAAAPAMPKPAQIAKAEPAPTSKAKPLPTAADKKKMLDQQVDALVNHLVSAPASSPKNVKKGDRTVTGVGAMNAMVADLQDSLRSQIAQCWSPPVGAPRAEELIVDFDLFLNPDGSVARTPQLTAESQAAAASDPYTRAAADAARRAIYECQPYKLPADRYKQWQEISPFHFDPRQMMGQ